MRKQNFAVIFIFKIFEKPKKLPVNHENDYLEILGICMLKIVIIVLL